MVRRITHSAVRIVRGLPVLVKMILAIAAVVGTLYGTIAFIVGVEYDRLEKARQKIGRQEFTKYKESVDKQIDRLESRLHELEVR